MSSATSSSICPAKLSISTPAPTPPPMQYALIDSTVGPMFVVCDMTRKDFPGRSTYIYRIDARFSRREPRFPDSMSECMEQLCDPAGEIYIRFKRGFKNDHVYEAIERIYVNAKQDHASVYMLYRKARDLLERHGGAPMVDLVEELVV